MMESGVPDYEVLTFIGVMAPAGTPPAIVARLNSAINDSLQSPEVVSTAGKLNADVRPASTREFGDFLAREHNKWSETVRRAGIKTE
jgi:tripartite-type tricarboxylate transporter receptor subunit TctC